MSPLPREEATPPVTNTCLVGVRLFTGFYPTRAGAVRRNPTHRTRRPGCVERALSGPAIVGHPAGRRCRPRRRWRPRPRAGSARNAAELSGRRRRRCAGHHDAGGLRGQTRRPDRPGSRRRPRRPRRSPSTTRTSGARRSPAPGAPAAPRRPMASVIARRLAVDVLALGVLVVAIARPRSWPIRSYVVASAATSRPGAAGSAAGCPGCRPATSASGSTIVGARRSGR